MYEGFGAAWEPGPRRAAGQLGTSDDPAERQVCDRIDTWGPGVTDLLEAEAEAQVLAPGGPSEETSTTPTCTAVLVVEDDALIARALSMALGAAGFETVACEATEHDAILQHARAATPRVVLLDPLRCGSGGSAPNLVAALCGTGAEVIALSDGSDRLLLGSVVEAGACDFISRLAPVEELVQAVSGALRGEPRMGVSYRLAMLQHLRRERAEQRARLAPFERLTPREAAVLGHMMDGAPAEAIATACYVSLPTVRTQIRAILTKLGVNSQLAAVAMAYRAGWSAPLDADR